jgi:hypothetical protein
MLYATILPVHVFGVQSRDLAELLPSIVSGLILFTVAAGIMVGLIWLPLRIWRRAVQRRGYPSLKVYLREVPHCPEERLDAVELTLKGVVICVLGLIFPPLCLVGLVPLYYGARKLAAMTLLDPRPGASQGPGLS